MAPNTPGKARAASARPAPGLPGLLLLVALLAGAAPVVAGPCPGVAPGAGAPALVQAAGQRMRATPPDPAAAAACFEAAFAAGDPGAAVARGQLALAGTPGPADPTLAASWFLRAARAGSPQGYLAVGLGLAAGRGVPADPYWGYWYLGRALHLPGLSPDETRKARDTSQALARKLTAAERATLDANLSGAHAP